MMIWDKIVSYPIRVIWIVLFYGCLIEIALIIIVCEWYVERTTSLPIPLALNFSMVRFFCSDLSFLRVRDFNLGDVEPSIVSSLLLYAWSSHIDLMTSLPPDNRIYCTVKALFHHTIQMYSYLDLFAFQIKTFYNRTLEKNKSNIKSRRFLPNTSTILFYFLVKISLLYHYFLYEMNRALFLLVASMSSITISLTPSCNCFCSRYYLS